VAALVGGLVASWAVGVWAQVRVPGYMRKDGTTVAPHYRAAPDGNPYNNYSFPGNVNPYTGQQAPGNPDTYLRRYPSYGGGGGLQGSQNSLRNELYQDLYKDSDSLGSRRR
jgi:hypothetical protein